MFATLPSRCIVLLEDIDAVGAERNRIPGGTKIADMGRILMRSLDTSKISESQSSCCSLSGLLNVLDGVASQEGRIVIMTTNHADKLDKALVRPGRIDKRVYLGYISSKSAELMFLRMYSSGSDLPFDSPLNSNLQQVELEALATEFGNKLRDSSLTPAQVQGYLLNHIELPVRAVEGFTAWIAEEQVRIEKKKAKMEEEKKFLEEEYKKSMEQDTNGMDMGNTFGHG